MQHPIISIGLRPSLAAGRHIEIDQWHDYRLQRQGLGLSEAVGWVIPEDLSWPALPGRGPACWQLLKDIRVGLGICVPVIILSSAAHGPETARRTWKHRMRKDPGIRFVDQHHWEHSDEDARRKLFPHPVTDSVLAEDIRSFIYRDSGYFEEMIHDLNRTIQAASPDEYAALAGTFVGGMHLLFPDLQPQVAAMAERLQTLISGGCSSYAFTQLLSNLRDEFRYELLQDELPGTACRYRQPQVGAARIADRR